MQFRETGHLEDRMEGQEMVGNQESLEAEKKRLKKSIQNEPQIHVPYMFKQQLDLFSICTVSKLAKLAKTLAQEILQEVRSSRGHPVWF